VVLDTITYELVQYTRLVSQQCQEHTNTHKLKSGIANTYNNKMTFLVYCIGI